VLSLGLSNLLNPVILVVVVAGASLIPAIRGAKVEPI